MLQSLLVPSNTVHFGQGKGHSQNFPAKFLSHEHPQVPSATVPILTPPFLQTSGHGSAAPLQYTALYSSLSRSHLHPQLRRATEPVRKPFGAQLSGHSKPPKQRGPLKPTAQLHLHWSSGGSSSLIGAIAPPLPHAHAAYETPSISRAIPVSAMYFTSWEARSSPEPASPPLNSKGM